MKRQITSLTILQTGKIFAVLFTFMYVVMLPFLLIPMLAGGRIAVAPMIGMLVAYPIIGFIGGILMAVIYNLAAKWVGGLEVSVEDTEGE